MPSPRTSDRTWLWLAALTAAALALRLYRLNSGLWIDEISSLLDSFRLPLGVIVTSFPGDNHHPLYSLLAAACLDVFGEHAWALRLPAAIFGAASIPLLYLLGRETVGERRGWIAALFLTVSYHHVWFSQNARGYSLLAFFAIAATYLLVRGLKTGQTPFFAAYALAAGLGAYTHLTMVFLAVGQAAVAGVLLLRRSAQWRLSHRQALIAFGGGAVITTLLYAPMLDPLVGYFNRPTKMTSLSTPTWAVAETIRALNIGFGWAAAAVLVMICVAGGIASLLRRNPAVLGLFAMPAVVTVAGAAISRGTMYPRFFFFLCGFAALILTEGSFWVGAQTARARWIGWSAERLGTAAALVVIAASAAALPLNYRFPKQDFGGAAAYVEARRTESESAAVVGTSRRAFRDYLKLDWPDLRSAEQLQQLRQQGAVWLVYAYPRYVASSQSSVWQLAERDCSPAVRLRGTVGDGDVYVLKCPEIP